MTIEDEDDGLRCDSLSVYTRQYLCEAGEPPPSDLWCVIRRVDGEEVDTLCLLSLFADFLNGLEPERVTIYSATCENIDALEALIARATGAAIVH